MIETDHFQSRPVDTVTMRVGRSMTRSFREINQKDPLVTVCLVHMPYDKPDAENCKRVQAVMDLLEDGVRYRKAKRAADQQPADQHCERCGEKLDPATSVELELSIDDSLYRRPGQLPAGHQSQGLFYFGAACARAVLKAGGHVVTIGKRAPANRPRRR